MQKQQLSCTNCYAQACKGTGKPYPAFCPSQQAGPADREAAMQQYLKNDFVRRVEVASSELVMETRGSLNRVEEIMDFARRMQMTKIGVATCVALMPQSRVLAKILTQNGFEVTGVGCKVGEMQHQEVGIKPELCKPGAVPLCNPVMQAQMLNEAGTQLNVVVGLCVGHDSLFMKYSDAICTTAVVKDRMLDNNPVLALQE